MSAEPIVIVGAGQAGGWAAQTLRKEGYGGPLVLIGEERHPPYERPPLSKAVLARMAAPDSTHVFKPETFAQLKLDWRAGISATQLDRNARQLALSDGSRLGYDKLILCTGGRARRLAVPGADLPQVFTLRTLDDAHALGAAMQPGKTVVVVGGGWIGLEVAATARKRGMHAVVVEAMGRLCERTVPPEISAHLETLHTAQGVEILLGTGVAGFEREPDGRMAVLLGDGLRLACDAVVVGVGLVPNDELARAAGLACEGGIVVDAQCRTSDPDIFAAGDVAVTPNTWAGRLMRLESWQNAQEQGIAAARSALGREVHYEPLPWFWSDQYDMNLQIYGIPQAGHQTVLRGRPDSGQFVLFYLHDSRVHAAIGPNAGRDLRFARRLIESRKQVTADSLADTDIPLSRL